MNYIVNIPDKVAYKTKGRTKTLSLNIYYNGNGKNEFFIMRATLKTRKRTICLSSNELGFIVNQLPKYKEMINDCRFISELFETHNLWSTPKQLKYIVENGLLRNTSYNSLCKRLFNAGLLYDTYKDNPFKYGEDYREDELLFPEYREKLIKYIKMLEPFKSN